MDLPYIYIKCKGYITCEIANHQSDQSVTHSLLLKEGLTSTLLVIRFVFLCIKLTESPCSGRHRALIYLPSDMGNIALIFLLIIFN